MYDVAKKRLICFDTTTDKQTVDAQCYSGKGVDQNKTSSENLKMKGPIPRGWWDIKSGYAHPKLGNPTFNLDPHADTDTFDRDLFRLHADNLRGDNSASEGCIVCSRAVREQIRRMGSGGTLLVR